MRTHCETRNWVAMLVAICQETGGTWASSSSLWHLKCKELGSDCIKGPNMIRLQSGLSSRSSFWVIVTNYLLRINSTNPQYIIHHSQQPPFEWGPSLGDIGLENQEERVAKVSQRFECKFKSNSWKCGAQSCFMSKQNWDGVKTGKDIGWQNRFSNISVCKEVSNKKEQTTKNIQDYNVLTGTTSQLGTVSQDSKKNVPVEGHVDEPSFLLQHRPLGRLHCNGFKTHTVRLPVRQIQTMQTWGSWGCHWISLVDALRCTAMHLCWLFLGVRQVSPVFARHTCIRMMIKNASKSKDQKYNEKERPQNYWVSATLPIPLPIYQFDVEWSLHVHLVWLVMTCQHLFHASIRQELSECLPKAET